MLPVDEDGNSKAIVECLDREHSWPHGLHNVPVTSYVRAGDHQDTVPQRQSPRSREQMQSHLVYWHAEALRSLVARVGCSRDVQDGHVFADGGWNLGLGGRFV